MAGAETGAEPGDLTPEARDLAADAMIRAATAPQVPEIGHLAAEALAAGHEDMTPAEIRALAATALGQAQQISRLMGRLADLLDAGVNRG